MRMCSAATELFRKLILVAKSINVLILPNRENGESSLVLTDILPKDSKSYDKNRPPKYFGQPTVVYFHVTVLSIDTINEESMVILLH